jgi:hypothetical protein
MYVPVSLVTDVSGWSRTGLERVTVTPGSTAPVVSLALPKISPVWTCAIAGPANPTSAMMARATKKLLLIRFLLSVTELRTCG